MNLFKPLFFTLICALPSSLLAIDAGITNPASFKVLTPLISSHIDNEGNYNVNGWSFGQYINRIRLYQNGSLKGSVNDATTGTWNKDVQMEAGVNEFYINVRSNRPGSPFGGEDSPVRYAIFVKPPKSVDIRAENFADRINIQWNNYSWTEERGSSGAYPAYFRLSRSETDSFAAASPLTNWTKTPREFDDTTVVPGKTYYYFLEVATNSTGQNPSGFNGGGQSSYRLVQLSVDQQTINAPSAGADTIVEITSNTSWSVISAPDWVTLTPSERSLHIQASENIEPNTRSGMVTIQAGTDHPLTRTISISQDFALTEEALLESIKLSTTVGTNTTQIEWTTLEGVNYTVKYSYNLSDWFDLAGTAWPIAGDGTRKSVTDPIGNPTLFPAIFYRVEAIVATDE